MSELLSHHQRILEALIKGDNYDTIYLDYQKAFDCCNQGVAASAIRKFGFQGKLGSWLYDFMRNRSQWVVVNNDISSPSSVLSGVPQGSVLGSLIFLLSIEIINDLKLEGNLGLFADDTREGMSIGNVDDAWKVQNDLRVIGAWSDITNMKFNSGKFECLKTGYNQDLKMEYEYITPDMDHIIESKDNIKDLGIWMSSTGDFSFHISKVISKVKQRIGWVQRSFRTNSIEFKKFMWRTYIENL